MQLTGIKQGKKSIALSLTLDKPFYIFGFQFSFTGSPTTQKQKNHKKLNTLRRSLQAIPIFVNTRQNDEMLEYHIKF